jgi:hypothetical protein
MHQIIKNPLNQSIEGNGSYSATVSNPKKLSRLRKVQHQTAINFHFTKIASGRKKFEKLNIG